MTSTTDTEPTPPGERAEDPRQGSSPQAPNKTLKRLQNYSVKNMVYSLLAVFALVFGLWALMPSADEPGQRRPVEVGMVASYAATESTGPIWSPEGAGPDWNANFANFQLFEDVLSWRVGLVTPSGEYVEISQADEVTDGWVGELTEKAGEQVGTRTITGPDGPQEWTAYEGEERALVLEPDGDRVNTTVVRGSADWAEMEEFIGLLEVPEP